MVDEGILIDLTHMRSQSIKDVLAQLDARDPGREIPVLATHMAYRFGGLQYSFDDETIKAVAARGGVLGCILCEHFITSGLSVASSLEGSLEALCRHIDKIHELTGSYDHIGIGSDLDGYIKPALPGLEDMSGMKELQAHLRTRYGDADAEKICSGNALRVLRAEWGRKRATAVAVSIGDRLRALSPNGELRTFLWVAAGAVGLVAYIYVVGWIVNLVRLSAARLPASAGVGALGGRQLLGDGLGSTLLMAAVFAVACAIAYFSSRRRSGTSKARIGTTSSGSAASPMQRLRSMWTSSAAAAKGFARETRRRRPARWRNARKRSRWVVVHGAAERVRTRNEQRAQQLPPEKPKELESAPLGDFAVRIVAGFNIMVLSALIALGVARFVTRHPADRGLGRGSDRSGSVLRRPLGYSRG